MTRSTAALATVALALSVPGAAAQTSADQNPTAAPGETLGRCMVLRSTGADRLVVARWLLGVLASAPQAADVTTLQSGMKDAADRDMAALFTRLMVKDCAVDAKAVFATGGGSTTGFQVAGEALGRVAMQELLTSPRASEAMGAYTKYLRPEDFKAIAPAR